MDKSIGFIGLGRMGLNMSTQLIEKGYAVIGTDQSELAHQKAKEVGVKAVDSNAALVEELSVPRIIWLMVPSKFVDKVLEEIVPLLNEGDTIIDGGNSFYKDSLRRHEELNASGINFLDCGTSGGMEGARHGASLMIGGNEEVFKQHEHIFEALAAKDGYARVGSEGAGHFVKMIHNGVEYGMMGAIAEGISLLHENENVYDIDLEKVFKPYEHESIITSKLVSWLREAYEEGQIDVIEGEVPKGETEEEMEHITTLGEVQVLEAALLQRKQTRKKPSYTGKLIAAMRNQFGGHKVISKK